MIQLSSSTKFNNCIDDKIKKKIVEHAIDFWTCFEQVDSRIEMVRKLFHYAMSYNDCGVLVCLKTLFYTQLTYDST